MLHRDGALVRYAALGSLVAIVVVVALLFLGPTTSQIFPDCGALDSSGSRPMELHFGVQVVAACSRQGLSDDEAEHVPDLTPGPPPRSPLGALGGVLSSIGGEAWQYGDLCQAGTIFDVNLDEWVEVRMALEFPLATPPSGAPIHSATLSLYHASGNGLDQLALYGYAGDGRIDGADAVVTGVPIPFAAGMLGYGDLDVMPLVTSEAVASGWAGFSIRADSPVRAGSGSGQSWECVSEANYPVLTIDYDTGS